jgi:hypothetical protein
VIYPSGCKYDRLAWPLHKDDKLTRVNATLGYNYWYSWAQLLCIAQVAPGCMCFHIDPKPPTSRFLSTPIWRYCTPMSLRMHRCLHMQCDALSRYPYHIRTIVARPRSFPLSIKSYITFLIFAFLYPYVIKAAVVHRMQCDALTCYNYQI